MKKTVISLCIAAVLFISLAVTTTAADLTCEPLCQARSKNQIGAANSLEDKGDASIVMSIEQLVRQNTNFRIALWTGDLLQLTAMSIPAGSEIGMEQHKDEDQFIYVIEGHGTYYSGPKKDKMTYEQAIEPGSGVFVPKGKWHNITNDGSGPLKLFSVYAPPHHKHGTIHKTEADDVE